MSWTMRAINRIATKWRQFLKAMAEKLVTISKFLKFSSLRPRPRSIACLRFIFRMKTREIYSSQTMSISKSGNAILKSPWQIPRLSQPMNARRAHPSWLNEASSKTAQAAPEIFGWCKPVLIIPFSNPGLGIPYLRGNPVTKGGPKHGPFEKPGQKTFPSYFYFFQLAWPNHPFIFHVDSLSFPLPLLNKPAYSILSWRTG